MTYPSKILTLTSLDQNEIPMMYPSNYLTLTSLGRVVGLPRVPDGMAGCISSMVGYVNIGKQPPESMLGALYSLLAAFGGGFRQGEDIIRV